VHRPHDRDRRLAAILAPGQELAYHLRISAAGVAVANAEFVGSDAGLGFGMVQATYSLNTPRLFGYIIVASVLGLCFYAMMMLVEVLLKRSHRWDWAFDSHQVN